jgi:hypothetical protein
VVIEWGFCSSCFDLGIEFCAPFDHLIAEGQRLSVASFSRLAVSEIRHGERKYFQPVVIMDPHGPSRPVVVEEADSVHREFARHSGRVLAGRTNVAKICAARRRTDENNTGASETLVPIKGAYLRYDRLP